MLVIAMLFQSVNMKNIFKIMTILSIFSIDIIAIESNHALSTLDLSWSFLVNEFLDYISGIFS